MYRLPASCFRHIGFRQIAYRHLAFIGLSISMTFGAVHAQMSQGLQLPQGMQGATGSFGGLTGGISAGGAAGMGSLGIAGASGLRSSDPLLQNSQLMTASSLFQPLEPLKPNDFQKFVLETAGFKLPLHGQAFFENLQFVQRNQLNNQPVSTPFAPLESSPVSPDYFLGPGDQVLIRGWGSLEIDVRAVVDRNGMVNIPKVGAVSLAGVKFAQAEGVVKAAVAKFYKDFQLSVTITLTGEDLDRDRFASLLEEFVKNNTEKSIVVFERGEVEGHLHAQCLMIAITTTPAPPPPPLPPL